MLNTTRFPAQCFRQFTPSGELLGVAVVAACFAIRRDGGLRQLLKQPPLVMSDIYEGEPLASPLLVQGDLVPYKPATDITFLGETFAPGGRPLPGWDCALDVGTISKKLRISGPRDWVRQYGSRLSWRRQDRDRWRLSDPVHVPKVALDWRKAFGGTISDNSESPADVVSDNPLGCGLLSNTIPAGIAKVPAPQIDTPDQSARVAFARPKPQGLAPIPPFWRPR